jgi:hypothetical protein
MGMTDTRRLLPVALAIHFECPRPMAKPEPLFYQSPGEPIILQSFLDAVIAKNIAAREPEIGTDERQTRNAGREPTGARLRQDEAKHRQHRVERIEQRTGKGQHGRAV